MLANENTGLLLFGFVVLHGHFWSPLYHMKTLFHT